MRVAAGAASLNDVAQPPPDELPEEEGADDDGEAYQLEDEPRVDSQSDDKRHRDVHGQKPLARHLSHARAPIAERQVDEKDEESDSPESYCLNDSHVSVSLKF